jgi:hypothetical protein
LTAATPEVDGSLFVAALQGGTTASSEPPAPQNGHGQNGNGVGSQAVQG